MQCCLYELIKLNSDRKQKYALTFSEQLRATAEKAMIETQALAEEKMNALNVGNSVEILDEEHQRQDCKLAVVIASTEKYIFCWGNWI